jgi:hypothetical protein
MLDCLVIVPFEPANSVIFDPNMRSTYLARMAAPLEAATVELEDHLGVSLDYWTEAARPTFAGKRLVFPKTRSLTAIILASALEADALSWRALDPGVRELSWWRRELEALRKDPPRTVAISTTYTMNAPWLRTLFGMVRRALPTSRIIAGGAFYASSARDFLSLDADVFCVGDGESRLPAIVRAVRDSRPLRDVRGIYYVDPFGGLQHTGHAEMVPLGQRAPIDWSYAARVEPAIDLANDLFEAGVESQRGCVFKCEFCSYRTLSPPNITSPSETADAIFRTAALGKAVINMVDATATFPHDRWKAILRELIARGGAPHPMWAYARVSDISEESASLMRQAGVRHLFIGQESGDQRMLDLMRKGTRVDQVRPAVAALARHGIIATFAFIHGFPGETPESLRATRRLMETINEGFEDRPPVLTYLLNPFMAPDLASVAARDEFAEAPHFLNHGVESLNSERIFAEVLDTLIAVSKAPHAPAQAHLFLKAVMPTTGSSVFATHDHRQLFGWLKAVERGICIFLERSVAGTRVDGPELRVVKERILASYPGRREPPPLLRRRFGKVVIDRLISEWRDEPRRGPGPLTRAYVAATAARQTADPGVGLRALRTGQVGHRGVRSDANVTGHAKALVSHALTAPAKLGKSARKAWAAS